MALQEVQPKDFNQSPFKLIGSEWMLITAEKEGKWNTMTASWGGLGVMWGKNVAFIVIRPQRYTKEFVDYSNVFSLSFFPDEYREMLTHFGTVSGREEDKIKTAGLTPVADNMAPRFEEAAITIICRKLYAQNFEQNCFLDQKIVPNWYPLNDFHTMYIAEIQKILIKE